MRLYVFVGPKQPQMLLLIQHKVRNIKAEDYSLREWADAAQYLSRQDCKFDSCEQAKKFILDL